MHKKIQTAHYFSNLFKSGFVIIDLETTGLDKDPHVDIVEVAIIDHEGNTLLNTLVKPRGHIPSGASRVHGIYDHHVSESPSFTEIYPQLSDILNDKEVIAYNHTFERNILRTVCRNYRQALLSPHEWHCAMRGYRDFIGVRRYQKLTTACQREQIVVKDAHRALGDCLMTLELVRKMAAAAT